MTLNWWFFPVLIFFNVLIINTELDLFCFYLIKAGFAFQIHIFYPGLSIFFFHSFVEERHSDSPEALNAVECQGIVISAYTKGTFLFFADPGSQTLGMVRMATKCDDVAVVLQTDRTALLSINMIRVGLIHVVIG